MIRFVLTFLAIGVLTSPLPLRASTNLPPTVNLVSPLHGSHAAGPAVICLAATAADADGTVASVEFFEGTNALGTDLLAPFALKITNNAAGIYHFTAVASDNLGAASTSAVASVTILTNGAPIKIMPLGDSTTAGYTTPGGYRIELWSLLTNAGLSIDFVGTQTNGPAELPDLDHEGHDGFTINQLKAGITNWLNASQPHIVLLQAGRNDVIQNADLTNAPARLGSLIDAIHAHSPNTHVIVSTLTPIRQYEYYRNSIPFNEAIPALVSSRAAQGQRVSLVDVNKALALFDLADGIHPTVTGYQKEARFWHGALIPLLTCEAPPLVGLTSPAANTTFLAPVDLPVTVGTSDPDGTVARVEYYLDALKVGEVTNAPFNFTLTNLGSGVFKLSARAIDDRGGATLTAPITLSNNLTLVRGVNVNGPALVVDGLPWLSWAAATNSGLSITTADLYGFNQGIPYEYELMPTPDGDTDIMMWSAFYRSPALNGQGFTLSQTISNGYYQVYLWMIENGIAHFRDVNARLEGVTAATGLGDLPKGDWRKYGPYPVSVTDGVLDLDILRHTKGDPSLYGFAIFAIDGTNTPPVISTIPGQSVDEDTSLGPLAFTVGDAEIGASLLTVSVSASNTVLVPTNGLVLGGSGANRTLTVHPASNQFGMSIITLTVSDGVNSTNTSFTVTVNAVNDAPSATSQSLTNLEDTPFGVTLSATDPETPALNYTILTAPQHGSLSGTAPNLTYTPSNHFFGADSFTFMADDGALTSAVATVSLTILAANDAPLAQSQSLTNNEDQPLAITLTGSDVENSPLTFQVVSAPAQGALSGTPPNLTYTPASNFFGADSFTFVTSDGALTSAVATVSLTILNLPDAPVATSTNLTNAANTPLSLALPALDPDGDPLLFTVTTTTTNGTLRVLDTNGAVLLLVTNGATLAATDALSYLPGTNFTGADTLAFYASDGTFTSAVASVTIETRAVFLIGVNLNGPAVTVEGNPWLSYASATNGGLGLSVIGASSNINLVAYSQPGPYGFSFNPPAESGVDVMFRSFFYASPVSNGDGIRAAQTVTNGFYQVYVWLCEPGIPNYHDMDLRIEGVTFARAVGDLPLGHWVKLGPYGVTVTDGVLDLDTLRHSKGEPLAFGFALFSLNGGNTLPAISSIADQSISEDGSTGPLAFTIGDRETTLDALSVTVTASNPTLVPTNGLVLGGSGASRTLTVTPATNQSGTNTITVAVSDGISTNTLAFTLAVAAVNDTPVAFSQSLTNAEDVIQPVTLAGSDVETATLNYTIITGPAQGTLSGTPPNLTYTPGTNYSGPDSFTFVVDDGALTSAVATVSLTITPVDDAPVAHAQTLVLAEDSFLGITLTGFDAESAPLTFQLVTLPAQGSLSGTAPNLTYTPASNYFGPDSLSFTVSDGGLTSAVAVVSLNVTNVNDPPVAFGGAFTNPVNLATTILLSGTDVDDVTLTYTVTAAPTNGTLRVLDTNGAVLFIATNGADLGTNNRLSYLPGTNYSGPDGFSFVANDGKVDSAPAAYAITVNGLLVRGINLVGGAVTIEGQAWMSYTQALAAGLSVSNASTFNNNGPYGFPLSPVPDADTDTMLQSGLFTITTNGGGFTLSQTLTNSDYLVYFWTVENFQDGNRNMDVRLEGVTVATNLADLPKGHWRKYGPFTTSVSDGVLDLELLRRTKGEPVVCGLTIYQLTTTPTNTAPAISDIANQATDEDVALGPLAFTVGDAQTSANDLTLSVQSSNPALVPTNNIVFGGSGSNRTVTVTPATNASGSATVTITVSDGSLIASDAFELTVNAVNDQPLAFSQSLTNAEDNALPITLAGTDLETTNLSFAVVVAPTHGVLSGVAPNLTYTPASNYFGADSFTFVVDDGALTSAVATVSLTITPVNDTPVAFSQNLTNAEDNALAITLTGTDVETTNLNFVVVAAPTHGVLSGVAPNLTYTSASNYFGADSFTFVVDDGALTSAVATVSLTVTPVNDAPVANSQSLTNIQNTAFTVTLGGSDPEGSNLTFTVLTQPTHGLLTGTAPNLSYQPPHGFTGADSFTFRVNDGGLDSVVATVNLIVAVATDSDGDGMPDYWEIAHGLNPAVDDADADSDGDGLSNYEEYLANTDPLDPDSALRVPTVAVNGSGHFTLMWSSVGGVRYRVQFSNGDSGGQFNGSFTDIVRPLAVELDPAAGGAASTLTFTDDFTLTGGAPPNGNRYFRVKVIP